MLTPVSGISIQPFEDQLSLRDCPPNTIQNFISIFGDQAPLIGDLAGFKCQKLPNGKT